MDWLLNLPIPWMTLVVLACTYAATAAIYLFVTRIAVGERVRVFKGVSPGMLPPLSVIFALLVGFLAAQVWSEADRAATAVNREASALHSAVLLADQFPGEPNSRLRELIRRHFAMVHCDNPAANRIILGIFGTSVAAAVVLIAAHSRPFSGAIAVRPTLLLQVMPEAGP